MNFSKSKIYNAFYKSNVTKRSFTSGYLLMQYDTNLLVFIP